MGAGFWVGFAGAMKEDRIRREDTEKEERRLLEERQWREGEAEKQRVFQREQFLKGLEEQRRDALLKMTLEERAKGQPTEEQRRAQLRVTNLLQGVEGGEDLLAAAIADPTFATTLWDKYSSAAEEAAKNTQPPPTGIDVVRSFDAFGIDAQPGDILDYSQLYSDILEGPMTPERYAEIQSQLVGGRTRGAMYEVDENEPLWVKPGDELWAKQKAAFDERILELAGEYEESVVAGDDYEEFSKIKQKAETSGTSAFYGMFGEQVAEEMGQYAGGAFRFADQNPFIGRFFKTATEEPETVLEVVDQTPQAFFEDPAQPPIEQAEVTPEDALVVPKTVDVGGRMVDISKMQGVSRDLIVEAGAIPYAEWARMSRQERKEAGLPVSEIGGQIRYANRDGGYDFIIKGWDMMKNFADSVKRSTERDLPKGYEGDTPSFTDENSATAEEQLRLALKLGRVNYGDTVIFNGKLMTVKEKK